MNKDIIKLQFNNPIKCAVCGRLNYADDYGNTDKCPNCGWKDNGDSEFFEDCHGISYPMLVPLSRAREQYRSGQKFKATFDDFINGLKFYSEMLFWHHGLVHEVFTKHKGSGSIEQESDDHIVVFCNKNFQQEFDSIDEFRNKANIDGRLLKNIWDEVIHPCFMYCGGEHNYDTPPED